MLGLKKFWLGISFLVLSLVMFWNNFYWENSFLEFILKFIFLVLFIIVLKKLRLTHFIFFNILVGMFVVVLIVPLVIIGLGSGMVLENVFEKMLLPLIFLVYAISSFISFSKVGLKWQSEEKKMQKNFREKLENKLRGK